MLSFYRTMPEVENDRRALNTTNGMRKKMQNGCWVSTAPLGYTNVRDVMNQPTLKINDDAEYIRDAFKLYAEGTFDIESLRKQLNKKYSKSLERNGFWKLLRNPVYIGKVFIKSMYDEPEQIVNGKHDAIITEELFNDVQDVLLGKKR